MSKPKNGSKPRNNNKDDYGKKGLKTEFNGKPAYKSGKVNYINNLVADKNDISWYNRIREVFQDSTLVSFFNQLGAKVRYSNQTETSLIRNSFTVPGVMVLRTLTTPGISTDINSPSSVAAVSMYEYVRSRLNKPNPDYGPADLHNFLFAQSDFVANYCNVLRAFAIANTFDADNYYLPYALAQAYVREGDDPRAFIRDIQENGANYRAKFNYLITEAATIFFMPEDYAVTQRHCWLFNNVFMDSNSRKSQMYIRSKINSYYLSEDGSAPNGTKCELINHFAPTGETITLDYYIEIMRMQFEAIRNSSSCRIMQSDLRQAFADRNQVGMMYVDERYELPTVISDEVLSQVENADVLGCNDKIFAAVLASETFDIDQDPDTDAVIYDPRIPYSTPQGLTNAEWLPIRDALNQKCSTNHVINLHSDNDPDKVMITTRNMEHWVFIDNARGYRMESCGADIISDMIIINIDVDDTSNFSVCAYPGTLFYGFLSQSATDANRFQWYKSIEFMTKWAAFDWAPKLPLTLEEAKYDGTTLSTDKLYRTAILEWDNYTVLSFEELDRLHRCAFQSMWNVPEYGAYNIK